MAETIINVFSETKEGSVTFAADSGINVVETDLQTYGTMTKDASTLYVITSLTPSS